MPVWKIAGVQMDCQLGNVAANLDLIRHRLTEAARKRAQLAIFPECALTGYAFDSADEARPFAQSIPGPATDALAATCGELGIWAVVGMLETAGDQMFNAAVLVGPEGLKASYRKIHLPFLGVDRFTTPGDQPFAVHDIDGLRVGMSICYDGSFPETTRILMLQGADLVVLPTNWPAGAESTVRHLVQCRALENHVYYAAVNRIGSERGTRYVGQSRLVNLNGDLLAEAGPDAECILYAQIDPERARDKQIVRIPGKYLLHRVNDRRPEMYRRLVDN
jgi:predicted amidohydrolase